MVEHPGWTFQKYKYVHKTGSAWSARSRFQVFFKTVLETRDMARLVLYAMQHPVPASSEKENTILPCV